MYIKRQYVKCKVRNSVAFIVCMFQLWQYICHTDSVEEEEEEIAGNMRSMSQAFSTLPVSHRRPLSALKISWVHIHTMSLSV